MEIKAALNKPYTDNERMSFIVENNHRLGYEIRETDEALEAWGYTQEEIAQQEAQDIQMLNLTAADVERAIYKAKGMDFEDVIALIEAQAPEGIDVKALKIELKANNFYRGNPYIDAVGEILGLSSGQMTSFFKTNDYKYLTSCTLTINPTPADAIVTFKDVEQKSIMVPQNSTITVPYGSTIEYTVSAEGYKVQSGTVIVVEDESFDVVLFL